jgi:hypothetical protein
LITGWRNFQTFAFLGPGPSRQTFWRSG